MEKAPASSALPGQSTGLDARYEKHCAAHDVARLRGDGMSGIRRAHVPFEADSANRCNTGSLPGERGRAVAGLKDGAGQPCMSCASAGSPKMPCKMKGSGAIRGGQYQLRWT